MLDIASADIVARVIAAVWMMTAPTEAAATVIDQREVTCLARNIYFETRDQSVTSQSAVAMVTLNRVRDTTEPDVAAAFGSPRPVPASFGGRAAGPVCRVIYQQAQFSWTATSKGRAHRMEQAADFDPAAWTRAVTIAALALTGHLDDPTQGARYFYSHDELRRPPSWTAGMVETAQHGDHTFLVDPKARMADGPKAVAAKLSVSPRSRTVKARDANEDDAPLAADGVDVPDGPVAPRPFRKPSTVLARIQEIEAMVEQAPGI